MSEDPPEKPKKGKGMLFGAIAAVLLGAGGGFATYSGMLTIPFLSPEPAPSAEMADEQAAPVDAATVYVALEPITVEIGRGGRHGRLRVTLTLQTDDTHQDIVEERKYRVADSLNSFLRAVDSADLREASKMEFIRSRILRRVMLEMPHGAVSDVLVSEFVVI